MVLNNSAKSNPGIIRQSSHSARAAFQTALGSLRISGSGVGAMQDAWGSLRVSGGGSMRVHPKRDSRVVEVKARECRPIDSDRHSSCDGEPKLAYEEEEERVEEEKRVHETLKALGYL